MKTFSLDVADEHRDDYIPGSGGDTAVTDDDVEGGLVAEEFEVDDDDDGETLDDDEGYEEEVDDEDESDEEESDEDEEEEDDGSTPGIDEVIRLAREHGGVGAEKLVRDLARSSVQSAEVNALRRELEDELREARRIREELSSGAKDEDEEASDEEDILSNVDPEELKILKAVMEKEGYIKVSDLDEEEQEELATELEKAGVEMFGDAFGEINEDGEFVLNEDIKQDLAPAFDRIVNKQNLTFRDLFVIQNIEKLIEAAVEAGYEDGVSSIKKASAKKVEKSRRASRSSSGNRKGSSGGAQLYNKEELKGKTGQQKITSVMQNVWNSLS